MNNKKAVLVQSLQFSDQKRSVNKTTGTIYSFTGLQAAADSILC